MTPEVAWTIASGTGLVLAIVGAIEAWRDLRALGGQSNGRRVWALADLRNQLARAVIQGAWLGMGLELTLDGREVPWSPIAIVLVATNAGIAILSAIDLRDRLRLYRLHGRS
ncbi:MAG TPA: hypothetical protein VM305_07575 [Candidatus Limnocylindrales bacterium]|nr:hypothetical protein [Candidatus Limnocylindrales bacterium]